MHSFITLCKEAERTKAKFKKLQLLSNLTGTGRKLLKWALDPYITYGIKQYSIPTEPTPTTCTDETYVWMLLDLLTKLSERKITGDLARHRVEGFLATLPLDIRPYINRIFLKNLSCGIGISTVNKAYPDLIPTFSCMLAYSMKKPEAIKYPCSIEAKYDGLRVIVIIQDGEVEYYTRKGLPIQVLHETFDKELLKVITSGVLDGEVLGNTFNSTMSSLGKMNKELRKTLQYVIFDYIPLEVWKKQGISDLQSIRSNEIYLRVRETEKVKVPRRIVAHTEEELQSFYGEVVDLGYEGVVIKNLYGIYKWKRSKNWQKLKPKKTYDGEIIDFKEGTGRLVNSLGSIKVQGLNENFITDCGAGFTDEERKKIWDNRYEFMLTAVELQAQGITQSKDNTTPALLFPVFKCFRMDL